MPATRKPKRENRTERMTAYVPPSFLRRVERYVHAKNMALSRFLMDAADRAMKEGAQQ